MMEPTWIRLIKLKGPVPSFAHPDKPEVPIQLFGSFHVRWPDGSVSVAELKTKKVHTRLRDWSEVSGMYSFFEVPFNGMEIIYNLHEVELTAEEVAKNLASAKRKAA
jgi:hypothetical protein